MRLGQLVRVHPYERNIGLDHVEDAGEFRREFLSFNQNYELLLTKGSSTLSKAMSIPLENLEHLVLECRNGLTPAQIKDKVEEIRTNDLELVCDGTYM